MGLVVRFHLIPLIEGLKEEMQQTWALLREACLGWPTFGAVAWAVVLGPGCLTGSGCDGFDVRRD